MLKRFLRVCSMLLVVVMLVNMLPAQALGAQLQEALQADSSATLQDTIQSGTTSPKEITVLSEITEKRSEYVKEYLLSNGTRMAAVYADPVHYEKDGRWEEIDNTLKAVGLGAAGTYENTAGIWQVSFPQQLSGAKQITITKDGYTLSFGMAGRLDQSSGAVVASAGETVSINGLGGSAETFAVAGAQTTQAQLQQVDLTTAKAAAQYQETVQDKLYSRLSYANVYANTNIVYDLQSNKVKESVILSRYDSTLRGYRYTLNTGGMIPVLAEDGHIDFYDRDRQNVIMTMPAPFLVDAANAFCYDVQVTLTGSGSAYTLTYLLPQQWLSDSARAWPVVLDPAITPALTVTNIHDITVFEQEENKDPGNPKWYKGWGAMQVGYDPNGEGISRIYLKYNNLPEITSSDVVVSATIQLRYSGYTGEAASVEVHKVNDVWDVNTITWANKPAHNENIEDYAIIDEAGHYGWIVTDIVRDWYANANTGMMFKMEDSVENLQERLYKQFYSSDYAENDYYQPCLTIIFRNNNGLESYWDYTSSSAGMAGTGYVNNFTGNLIWTRSDIGFGGNLMPVSISHVYNANDAVSPSDGNNSNDSGGNALGLGYGWRTNFNQLIYQWSLDNRYYIWEDADGTDHYFIADSSGTLRDEDGLELTLTISGSEDLKYCITDKYGNKSYFDTYGRLRYQQNNQAETSTITITYTTSTGKQISAITDGAGRIYVFTYTGGLLSRISYKGKGSREISYVSYGYTNGNLTQITNQGSKACYYAYNGAHLLTSVQDVDGYTLAYTYNTVGEDWQPYRVQSISESDNSTEGGTLTFAYAHNKTTLTDHNGNVQILQFNDFGNTISIQDDEGHAQFAQFAFNTDVQKKENTDATKKGNQLLVASQPLAASSNLLQYGHMRADSILSKWPVYGDDISIERTTASSYADTWALKVTNQSGEEGVPGGISTEVFLLEAGQTHTFSCYVKPTGADVYLMAKCGADTVISSVATTGTSWRRLQVTYTNTTSQTQQMRYCVVTENTGEFYVDCAQLESAYTASRYNLLVNGDFNFANMAKWVIAGCNTNDGRYGAEDLAAPQLDDMVFRIFGSPTAEKYLEQKVFTKGGEGDAFVFSGWAKGNAAPSIGYDESTRIFAIQAKFHYTDGTTSKFFTANFNPDTASWQYTAGGMVAEKAYNAITVRVEYSNNVNTVYFDGIQLCKDEFGSTYKYDENGNVLSVKDAKGKETTYEYTQNNLTEEVLPTGVTYTYEYDNQHNVIEATTNEGLKYTFDYDDYGNNTSVSISDGSKKISSTATYTADGNRLESTTDALGNTTVYSYNENTNVLEWVKTPNDTDATRTNYTYDTMFRLATARATTNTGSALTAAYSYNEDGMLSSIQTASTTYNFAYGDFGLRTSISIGNQTLATYKYTDDGNNYLSELDYGNGDGVEYTYDDKGRVIREKYEDGDTVSYAYDDAGTWMSVTDSATGITATYTYDYLGRLRIYEESGPDHSLILYYTYNLDDQLIHIVEHVDGYGRGSIYTYDDDDRLATFKRAHGIRAYSYDDFSRVSSHVTSYDERQVYTTYYTFVSPKADATSSQVASVRHVSDYYDTTYSYTYDNNGNILTVSDGTNTTSYVYDSANQLIRENNPYAQKTWTWTYDNAGNILSRYEYAYTTGALGGYTDLVEYFYEDGGDLLTMYDDNAITYDQIGNPLTDGTWNYTWEHGRQLDSMTKVNGSVTWDYTYNANGMRIKRTNGSKTYEYTYAGSELVHMSVDGVHLRFGHTPDGVPFNVVYGWETYFYVTNLQGDVVAILDYYGDPMVYYTYDAWGNILSITGSMATTLGALNPFRYRGYVYDTETGLYYVSSRYYNPEIGRWISPEPNVDYGEFDEGAGLLGYNVYTYCANNPVIYKDSTGEGLTIAIFGIALGIKSIIALAVTIVTTVTYTVSPAFRRSLNNMVSSAFMGIDKGLRSIYGLAVNTVNVVSAQAKSIARSIADSFARTQTISTYKTPREVHHIVAQRAKNAKHARKILMDVKINYNDPVNLVSLKTGLHRRLHTDLYYGWANSVIISAYYAANGNRVMQKSNVIMALNTIRAFLLTIDATCPY